MIEVFPVCAAALLAVGATSVARCADPRSARRLGLVLLVTVGALLAVADLLAEAFCPASSVSFRGLELVIAKHGWHAGAAVVDLMVALIAVGLAPIPSHSPRSFASILWLIAVAMTFVSVTHPALLTALWVLSALVFWRGVRAETGAQYAAKVSFVYQGASALLACAGGAALWLGFPLFAGACWCFAILLREAGVPFHGWLPIVAERVPLGLLVAYSAPQIGIYAHITLLDGLIGHGYAELLAWVGVVTVIAAAAIGLAQNDARRAVAWLMISQTGLIAFGLDNHSEVARAGAVLCWQVMAVGLSGFMMTIAALEARRGKLSLREPGGSFARTPRMAVAFLILGFASVGLPLTLGFVSEDLLLQGSVEEFPHLALAMMLGTALNGMNVMRCFFTLFSGTREHIGEQDLQRREQVILTLVLALLFLGGIAPRLAISWRGTSEAVEASHGHPHAGGHP